MPAGQPPNLHSLYMSGMYPLGVECLGCRRRSLVPAERFGACKGDMREIHSLRLVRSSCGARDWEAKVFIRAGQAEAWLDGLTVSPVDGGRPAF
jgi:hypothetical protein